MPQGEPVTTPLLSAQIVGTEQATQTEIEQLTKETTQPIVAATGEKDEDQPATPPLCR
ncbi:MAG: hypothetical protein HY527_19750 [Betaproteobacteria bacterium]|nr:hypothetical protein [Betaproteobacteria bacterium]